MANIPDGNYTAAPDSAAVYEKNNKLVIEVRFNLTDENGTPYNPNISRSKRYWVTNNAGSLNTKIIEQIKKWCTAWDGTDPWWFTEAANVQAVGLVEVVIKTESYTNQTTGETKPWQDIEWVNPIGGGGYAPVANGDKATIMAKYGAMFRSGASAVPKPVSAASLKKPTAPTAPVRAAAPARPVPAAKAAPKYANGLDGQGQVWDAYCAETEGKVPNAERDDAWFAALDKIAPGRDQADLSGEDWGKVAAELGVQPF